MTFDIDDAKEAIRNCAIGIGVMFLFTAFLAALTYPPFFIAVMGLLLIFLACCIGQAVYMSQTAIKFRLGMYKRKARKS